MGKVADDLRKAIEARQRFEEFKKLKETCLSVFESYARITMDFIEQTINNEWQQLYSKVSIYNQENITHVFGRVKDGYINRKEFKEEMKQTIEEIEEEYQLLKEEAEKAEKQFSDDYDEFFEKSPDETVDFTVLFLIFSQPEAKEIIKNFLNS